VSVSDGQRLADEILAAIAPITREGLTEERAAARAEDGRPADARALWPTRPGT
jgi:hypothetical protein